MTAEEKSHPSHPTLATVETTSAVVDPGKILSGKSWCASFPGSKSTDDLKEPFKAKFLEFYRAMEKAGCSLNIASTFRPPKRAYLMHFSWRIVHENYDAKTIPSMDGVNINWDHGDAELSKKAAEDMCAIYQTNHLKVYPSLTSQHTLGFAVDMNITWAGDLSIEQKDGQIKEIKSEPRNRMNTELHEVGAGYGIIKYTPLDQDKPHWSDTGK